MPVIDSHAYFGPTPETVREGSLAEIERVLGESQIGAVLLASALAVTGDFRRGNHELDEAIAPRNNMFGYVTVNAHYPEESGEEVRVRLQKPWFRGIKLPRESAGPRIDSEGFRSILHMTRRFGRPVFCETTCAEDVRDVVELAKEYHTLKFVLGGMAGDDWETAVRACEEQLNCVLEIGSLSADRDKVGEAVRLVSPRRVLFGSHFPRLHPHYVLGMVKDAEIEPRDRERIVWRNAAEIFELRSLSNEGLSAIRQVEQPETEPEGEAEAEAEA